MQDTKDTAAAGNWLVFRYDRWYKGMQSMMQQSLYTITFWRLTRQGQVAKSLVLAKSVLYWFTFT